MTWPLKSRTGDATGQTRRKCDAPRGVAAGADGIGADHLIHQWLARIGKGRVDHRGGEVVQRQAGECPAARHDCGASGR